MHIQYYFKSSFLPFWAAMRKRKEFSLIKPLRVFLIVSTRIIFKGGYILIKKTFRRIDDQRHSPNPYRALRAHHH